MRLLFLPFFFCLLGLVASMPLHSLLQERDFASVEKCILRYKDSLQELVGAIYRLDKDFRGDTLRQGQDIENKGNAVTETMRREGRNVRGQERLNWMDTLKLVSTTSNLAIVQDQVSKAWISQQPTITLVGGKPVVLRMLREHVVANDQFIDAVMSRLPADMGVGKGLAEMSKKWLDDSIDAFK
jgi:hypothetical protein